MDKINILNVLAFGLCMYSAILIHEKSKIGSAFYVALALLQIPFLYKGVVI